MECPEGEAYNTVTVWQSGALKRRIMKMIKRLRDKGTDLYKWLESRASGIALLVFFGCVVYWMLLSQNLVNSYDGLWHNSSYFAAIF